MNKVNPETEDEMRPEYVRTDFGTMTRSKYYEQVTKDSDVLKKCILCHEEKSLTDFNKEHVFPEAIGGSLVLEGMLCTDCNSTLGHTVDAELVNNDLVRLACQSLKIKGKRVVPNPLLQGHIANDERRKIQYRVDKYGNPEHLYQVPFFEDVETPQGKIINFGIDVTDKGKIPDILRKIAARSGVTISQEQIDEAMQTPVRTELPSIKIQFNMHVSSWKKALIKIAYELSFYGLGSAYFDDLQAEKMRKILKSNINYERGNEGLDAVIRIVGDKKIIPYWTEDEGLHFACLRSHGLGLHCYIRLFQFIEALIPVSDQNYGYDESNLPAIFINAKNATHRKVKFIDAIHERSHEQRNTI